MKMTFDERKLKKELFGNMTQDEFMEKYPDQQKPFLSGTQLGIFGYMVGMSSPQADFLITAHYWCTSFPSSIIFHNIRWFRGYKTAKLFFIKVKNFLDYIDALKDENVFSLMKDMSIYKLLEENLFNQRLSDIKTTKDLINSYELRPEIFRLFGEHPEQHDLLKCPKQEEVDG
jgi:hypothetical protein